MKKRLFTINLVIAGLMVILTLILLAACSSKNTTATPAVSFTPAKTTTTAATVVTTTPTTPTTTVITTPTVATTPTTPTTTTITTPTVTATPTIPTTTTITTPVVTATPTATPTTAPSTVPSASPTPTPAPTATSVPGPAVTLNVTAQSFAFDKGSLSVPAGASVTLIFNNKDAGVPHNVSIYQNLAGGQVKAIFVGEIIRGTATVTYTFTAPAAGATYFFQCDVHPMMTGQFVVTP